jgi:hypothetical protein
MFQKKAIKTVSDSFDTEHMIAKKSIYETSHMIEDYF